MDHLLILYMFSLMVFLCFTFGALANKIGVKWILVLGTLGYAPYSAALYVNNRYGVEWFVIFGGATCGVAAAALWSSEAAIALGYAGVGERGKFSMSCTTTHTSGLFFPGLTENSWYLAWAP